MTEVVDRQAGDVAAPVTSPAGPVLRSAGFRLLVAGQLVSTCGDMFFLVAMPYLIFATGGGARLLTATLGAFGLARVLVVLPAGTLTDRIGPRAVMLLADGVRGVAVGALTLTAVLGHPPAVVLIAVAAVLGAGEGGFQPASRAMTPLLVDDAQLPAANSINVTATMLATMVGPALGGIGVAAASPATMLGLDALSYAVSVATLVLIRTRAATAGDADTAPGETGAGQPRTVAGFFRASAFFRAVLAMMAVIGLVIPGTLQVALPVLTRRTAGLGVTGYGFLVTALGIGMVLGGLSAGRLGSRPHQGRLVIGLLAVHAGLLAALPAWPGLAGKLAGMALLGAADGALGVIVITVLQRMPPPYLRGRVLAALAFVNFAAYPLSVLVAGQLVGHAGPAAMFWVAGAGIAGVALIGLASAAVRDA